jgi:hypothetical protein
VDLEKVKGDSSDQTHRERVWSVSRGERTIERGRPNARCVRSSLTGHVQSLKPHLGGLLELTGRCRAVRMVTLSCVKSLVGSHGCAHDRTRRPCVQSLSSESDRSLNDWLAVFDHWNLTNAVERRDMRQASGDRTQPTSSEQLFESWGSINRKVPTWVLLS